MASSLPLGEAKVVDDPAHVLHHNDLAHYVNLLGKETYNVKAYGAVGDGVADDTTAINAAITAVPTAGGILFFPPGIYKISAALALKKNLVIQGSGVGDSTAGTRINQTSTTANGMTLTNIADPFITIQDLKLVGPGSGSGVGISMTGNPMGGVSIKRVMVSTFGSHGFYLGGPIVSSLDTCVATSNGGTGFFLDGTTLSAVTSVNLTACYSNANTGHGYWVRNNGAGTYSNFNACAADSNTIGYLLETAPLISLSGCGAEANTISYKFAGSTYCTAISCFSFQNNAQGFWVTNGTLSPSGNLNSNRVSLISCSDSGHRTSSVAGFQVDSTSHATLINPNASATASPYTDYVLSNTAVIINDQATAKLMIGARLGTGLTQADLIGADTLTAAQGVYISGDTVPRWQVLGSGKVQWGDGTAAVDTAIYRGAAGRVSTDGVFFTPDKLNVGATSSASKVYVEYADSATASVAMQILETAGTANATAHMIVTSQGATKRVLDAKLPADTSRRLSIRTDGLISMGDGATLDTNVYRAAADVLATDDDLRVATIGKGLQVKGGTGARIGQATMVTGTVTIANTTITTNTRVFFTRRTTGGTPGHLSFSTVASTSFTLNSSSATETSTFDYMLVEQV